jgi:arylsulfatase
MPEGARPNLLLVTIDTLRADHLGLYGYFRDTSPHIDRFAEDALVFDRAFAPLSATLPTHVSLLTGTHPIRHGIVTNFRFFGHGVSKVTLRTAAEMLGEAGWATAAFTSASPLSAPTGIGRGFGTFHGPEAWSARKKRMEIRGQDTVDAARAWLAEAPAPFFLWVHLFDPHHPYEAPPGFRDAFHVEPAMADHLRERGFPPAMRRRVPPLLDAYDAEIAYADQAVGSLLEAVRAQGLWEETVVVLAADHGEGLWQHGTEQHGLTWNEEIRVPLVMRIPGGPRGRSDALASLLDVLPTLAAHANLPFDAEQLDGVDLLEGRRESVLSQRIVMRRRPEPVLTLIAGDWKYWHVGEAPDRLYHVARDPHEQHDVIEAHPEVARRLLAQLRARVAEEEARAVVPVEKAMPADVREQLRALGYVE